MSTSETGRVMRAVLALRNGRTLDLMNPDPNCLDIEVIGNGLAREMRWGNQTVQDYSVAQHSLNVETCVHRKLAMKGTAKTREGFRKRRQALFHDASEFVFKDIASPAKQLVPDYKPIERRIMDATAQRFHFDWPATAETKEADVIMACTEWNGLMPNTLDEYFTPEYGFPEDPASYVLHPTEWDRSVYDSKTISMMWQAKAWELLRGEYA